MSVPETTKKLIENYLHFFKKRHRSPMDLKPILSEKLHFRSPLGEFHTAESFMVDLERDALEIRELNIRQILVDGAKACALYDVVSNDPEIGTLVFSEWFETSGGKISTITSTYDASDIRRSMSRI